MSQTVEGILVELGDRPLRQVSHGKTLQLMINAHFSEPKVTLNTTGDEALELLYRAQSTQSNIADLLTRTINGVIEKDSYRSFLIILSLILMVIAIGGAVAVMLSPGNPNSSDSVGLLGKIVDGIFNIMQLLLNPDSADQ